MITKTDNILYSALRNAIAPSAIFFAILPIFSEPTSLEATQLFFKYTNRSASIPALGMKYSMLSIVVNLIYRKYSIKYLATVFFEYVFEMISYHTCISTLNVMSFYKMN